MKGEFVTYEHSLALKELGFDERCFGHYNPNGVFFWKILCSDEDNDHTLSVKDIMEHVADGYVEAPLYQQAFRWFREKHNLFCEIQMDRTTEPKFCFVIFKYEHFGNYEKVEVDEWYLYRTYEEAEHVCLDKLIQIVKTNNNERR
jgi:hypothetical protein